MWQSLKTLNVFNTLFLKQIFWKAKAFSKKLVHRFLVESTKIENVQPMLRQIKWWLQNEPIKKNGVLPVTTLFFWKICFSLRTSCKELVCCIKNPNAHICTFCKPWSFIWQYFFAVSNYKTIFEMFLFSFLTQTTSMTWLLYGFIGQPIWFDAEVSF